MKLSSNIAYVFSGRRAGWNHLRQLLLEVTVNRRRGELMLPAAGRRNRRLNESLD